MAINRRRVVTGVGASLGAIALRGFALESNEKVHFTHAVASGDPLNDRVMIWTRVIPGSGSHQMLTGIWQVAADESFAEILAAGKTSTSDAVDYTVKVDATGLPANTKLRYRFIFGGQISPVGRTKTLPVGTVSEFKIGIASCSNYPQGYFNAYRHMSETDLDLVLHLGDYIYEYAQGRYVSEVATKQLGRIVKPDSEILSLEDYRMRYGLYRTDPDLMAVHQRHPFICVWDDHELTNNTWKNGAENHNEGEGDFHQRIRAARQAYHEWMPIRTGVNGDQSAIFRSFKIGDLADLHMLDTRLHGRDQGLEYAKDLTYESITFDIRERSIPRAITTDEAAELKPEHTRRFFLPYDYSGKQPVAITDYQKILDLKPRAMPDGWGYSPDVDAFRKQKLDSPARTLLGRDQEQWLADALRSGQKRGSKWQIIGQQVLMGRTGIPKLTIDFKGKPREYVAFVRLLQSLERLGLPFNLDAWDGYPASRQRVYKELLETSANPIVLSGDTHNAWAFNLTDDEGLSVGVEIGTPGITSPGLETDSTTKPDEMSAALMLASPELIEVDTSRRGWAELVITPTQTSNQWHFVDTILSRDFTVSSSVPLICKLGDKKFSAS